MPCAALNLSSSKQKNKMFNDLPSHRSSKRRKKQFARHSCRKKDELICAVILWTPKPGHTNLGSPFKTYVQQLCEDAGCKAEELPGAMNAHENWRERLRRIHTTSMT